MATVNIEVQARTEAATRNLKNLTASASDIGKKFNDDAAGALGVFGVSLTALDQPLTLVADALKQSITAAAEWGDSMGDLAQLTGSSVHEVSKMSAAFELVGVSTGSIEQAMKAMSKNGLSPTIDTFKKLSEQYKSIQDPAARTEFLFKNFGRAGLDLAEIMGRDTAELDKLSAAAVRSGKVIGDDAANAAEDFNTNLAIFQQRVEGAQIALGNALIPTLNAAFTSFDQLTTIVQVVTADYWDFLGIIDENTAAQMKLTAAGIDPTTAATETMTVSISEATAANKDMADSADLSAAAQERQKLATDAANTAAVALAGGMADLTAKTLFNQAAAGLDSVASLELARSMGLINEEAAGVAVKVADLKTKYDANHDGAISAAEGAAAYAREVAALANAMDLVKDKTVTLTVRTVGGDIGQVVTGGDGGNQLATRRAAGGPVNAGQLYMVGEQGPEYFVPRQSGTIIPNGAGPSVTVGAININGAGNPQAVAAAVRAEMDRMGRQTDVRLRTR